MKNMQVLGTWRGFLFIDTIKEYIEDEVFQIEIQSVDAQNTITATVKEQVQTEGLSLDRRDGFTAYHAEGPLDTKSGEFQLSYRANSTHGESISVELMGIVDEEKGTIMGQYRLLSQRQWQASFQLKKTEAEPL